MSRITVPASIDDAPEAARPLLQAVQSKVGFAPNLYKVLAHSPAALEGALGLSGALGKGALDAPTRERIALAIANVNGCDYCNAAHTAIGGSLKLDAAEIEANRRGRSNDARIDVAVAFARKVAVSRADVSEADVEAVRLAGYSDAQIVEIVAHVGLNVLTNYVNEVFKTPIDFPAAAPATRAA
jgi:uncharacterized peroxidase-related enzyme